MVMMYDGVYNKRVVDYPTWTFKESIGPHNTILYIWFSAGILVWRAWSIYMALLHQGNSQLYLRESRDKPLQCSSLAIFIFRRFLYRSWQF